MSDSEKGETNNNNNQDRHVRFSSAKNPITLIAEIITIITGILAICGLIASILPSKNETTIIITPTPVPTTEVPSITPTITPMLTTTLIIVAPPTTLSGIVTTPTLVEVTETYTLTPMPSCEEYISNGIPDTNDYRMYWYENCVTLFQRNVSLITSLSDNGESQVYLPLVLLPCFVDEIDECEPIFISKSEITHHQRETYESDGQSQGNSDEFASDTPAGATLSCTGMLSDYPIVRLISNEEWERASMLISGTDESWIGAVGLGTSDPEWTIPIEQDLLNPERFYRDDRTDIFVPPQQHAAFRCVTEYNE